jgi:hypothetical protein
MTPDEQEFAVLIDTFDNASRQLTLAKQQAGDKPEYYSSSGYITPTDTAAYKKSLAQYEQIQQTINEAQQAVNAASAAIDAWLPDDLRISVGRVAISAPMPGKHAMLFEVVG